MWYGVSTSGDYCTVVCGGPSWDGFAFVFCGHGCMLHADLGDGLVSCTNENAGVQIWSSQGPSIGLVEGPHEDVNTGTQYENGVLYIPVHHSRDSANECNLKSASLEEAVVCKCLVGPKLFRPSCANFFHHERAIFFHFSIANNLASFRFLGGAPTWSTMI